MSTKENEGEHLPLAMTNHLRQPSETNANRQVTTSAMASNTVVVATTTIIKHHSTIEPGYRDNWSNRIVYLLSIIGFVVDLGRVFIDDLK